MSETRGDFCEALVLKAKEAEEEFRNDPAQATLVAQSILSRNPSRESVAQVFEVSQYGLDLKLTAWESSWLAEPDYEIASRQLEIVMNRGLNNAWEMWKSRHPEAGE